MSPVGIKPFSPPPTARQPATIQDRLPAQNLGLNPEYLERDREQRRGQDRLRRQSQKQAAPLPFKKDSFERPTVKLPAVQQGPKFGGAAAEALAPRPAPKPAPKPAAKKPEATMLIQARDLRPSAPAAKPAAAPAQAQAPQKAAAVEQKPAGPGAMEGLRRRGAELAGRMAGAASRALDGMELSTQLKRVSSPNPLWNAAAKVVGAAGDAARSAASRFNLFAQGVQTAQTFADNGAKLPLPRGGAESPQRAGSSAQDWRRANEAFATSDQMIRSLQVADDDGARHAAASLLPILMDHAQRNPSTSADAIGAMRRVSDAASALGRATEPADAAQAARELRSAGKQVRQLFAEQGGGAQTLSTDQAASLQRLATVVRGGDAASEAFKRGSHRSLAAIGANLATALSQGGDGQAAQAIALRDRTHALLAAQSSGNETETVAAAKRLHVAIRQAQTGAQWERDRLLGSLARAA